MEPTQLKREVMLDDHRRSRRRSNNGIESTLIDEQDFRLEPSTLRDLGESGELYVVDPDDEAGWLEAQPGRWYLIDRGCIELSRVTWSGRKLVLTTLGPGEVFGGPDSEEVQGEPTIAKLLPDSRLYAVEHTDLVQELGQDPGLAAAIVCMYASRLRRYETEIQALAFDELSQRLAALLLELSTPSANDTRVVRGFSHQELADRIGTYRETLTALLGRFRENGWVRTARKEVELLDVDALVDHVPWRRRSSTGGHKGRDHLNGSGGGLCGSRVNSDDMT